jgi:hypothetical protein
MTRMVMVKLTLPGLRIRECESPGALNPGLGRQEAARSSFEGGASSIQGRIRQRARLPGPHGRPDPRTGAIARPAWKGSVHALGHGVHVPCCARKSMGPSTRAGSSIARVGGFCPRTHPPSSACTSPPCLSDHPLVPTLRCGRYLAAFRSRPPFEARKAPFPCQFAPGRDRSTARPRPGLLSESRRGTALRARPDGGRRDAALAGAEADSDL